MSDGAVASAMDLIKAQLVESVFAGGGEMGARMRALDWSATVLGPLDQWPQSLRARVGVMLGSGNPMLVCWGPAYTMHRSRVFERFHRIEGTHGRTFEGARLYWEYFGKGYFNVKGVSIPGAVSSFPDELYPVPRSWAEQAYPKLIHFNKLPMGGHFAAWEQPQLFSEELRAGFRSLR